MGSNAVAVIGMGCRFPGCNSPEEFWEKLSQGVDCITSPPADRPYLSGIPFQGGFLSCPVDAFDAAFWGFSPREAPYIDPQQRLLLEVSWEALENSGMNPLDLKGSDTAVFLGIWLQDYNSMLPGGNFRSDDFHRQWLCNAFSCAASRLSHILGLNGASQAYEAACASSLVAVHNGVQALLQGSTSLAIVSGVNLILSTDFARALAGSSVLAPDFRCKTFDATANGYVRSEGAGAVILKRLDDAQRDGDNILGVVLGSACNTDGAGTSFGAPNHVAQAKVFQTALNHAKIRPEDVTYLEAHGTGTPVGDPTEIRAVASVYSSAKRQIPLIIGSVKANIGHSEAAAGIASFIKALLCIKHGLIPKQINLKTLNPRLDLAQIPATIPTENTIWPCTNDQKNPRIAAVNTFGMSGTNVHVILREPPQKGPTLPSSKSSYCLVPISAKNTDALNQLLKGYSKLLNKLDEEELNLTDLALSAATTRAHFLQNRACFVVRDLDQLGAEITKELERPATTTSSRGNTIGFLFTGQGAQYSGMAKELFNTSHIFRRELVALDKLFFAQLNVTLESVLWGDQLEGRRSGCYGRFLSWGKPTPLLETTLYAQPTVFCVQVALFKMWKALGVIPQFVLGHSLGEFAAAVCAGIVSVEHGLRMVIGRAKLIESLPDGAMLAIRSSNVASLLKEFSSACPNASWVDVAAVNSATDFVIAAESTTISALEAHYNNDNAMNPTRRLAASHAFHSRAMDKILGPYRQLLNGIQFHAPVTGCVYISGATGQAETSFNPAYWVDHLRKTVQFSKAVAHFGSNCSILVEIGPQPVLLGLARRNIDVKGMLLIPSLKKDGEDWYCLLQGLRELYIKGKVPGINWANLYESGHKLSLLPTYPFQRKRFWFKKGDNQQKITPAVGVHPLLGVHTVCTFNRHEYESTLDLDSPRLAFLKDHCIGNKVIFPAAAYLEMMLAVWANMTLPEDREKPVAVQKVILESALEIGKETTEIKLLTRVTLLASSDKVEWEVTIFSKTSGEEERCATAVLVRSTEEYHVLDISKEISQVDLDPSPEGLYDQFHGLGFHFKSEFRSIKQFGSSRATTKALTQLPYPSSAQDSFVCHPIVLDAVLQTAMYAIYVFLTLEKLTLPIRFRRFTWYGGRPGKGVVMMCSWASLEDISMYDQSTGKLLGRVEGLEYYSISLEQFLARIDNKREGKAEAELFEQVWRKETLPDSETAVKNHHQKFVIISTSDKSTAQAKWLQNRLGNASILVEIKEENSTEYFHKVLSSQRGDVKIVYLSFEDFDENNVKSRTSPCLHFLKAMMEARLAGTIHLFPVTSSTLCFDDSETNGLPNPTSSAVQGLFQGFRAETPHINTLGVDIDESKHSLESLLKQIQTSGDMSQFHLISIRKGETYTPKLIPAPFIQSKGNDHHLFSDKGTYLITGAGRGIGLALFEWMVSQGAKYFVLAARTEPQGALKALLQDKENVVFVQADVGDREGCIKLFSAAKRPGFPPLKGIFHSAGVLHDAMIQNQSEETLQKVFGPKVGGAWSLHELSLKEKLDHFVLFSSIVSVIGNLGQSNYIAANYYVDALAKLRLRMGLPATTINWGPWSDIGMAADSKLGQNGDGGALKMKPISPSAGFLALEAILRGNYAQTVVLGSGSSFSKMGQILRLPHLLSTLIAKEKPSQQDNNKNETRDPQIHALLNEMESKTVSLKTVQDCLKAMIRQILGLEKEDMIDEEMQFPSLGMDSLMNIELISIFADIVPTIRKSHMSQIQEQTTVNTMAAYIFKILSTLTDDVGVSEGSLEEIVQKDATLPTDINCSGTTAAKIEKVLLTGATGFMGCHFLAKLNQMGIVITCLIRGTDGKTRLVDTLAKFGLLNLVDMTKIKIITGDVGLDRFGLPETEYNSLASQIDAIVHCAAIVNHLEEYTNTVRHNTLNMIPVLRFAVAGGTIKRLLFPSTLLTTTKMENGQLMEQFPGAGEAENGVKLLKAGYILSKYASEMLLGQAASRGVPCTLVRFPTLLGSKTSGRFGTKYNHYSRLLLACIKVGHLPQWGRQEIPLMPVDVAVDIAVMLFISGGGVYNLTFDNMPTEKDFKDVVKARAGVDMSSISFVSWTKKVMQVDDSPLWPFRQHYQESEEGAMPKITRWNILYTTMLSAKLDKTSQNVLAKLPNVNDLTPLGKDILEQHLLWLERIEPQLCSWIQNNNNE